MTDEYYYLKNKNYEILVNNLNKSKLNLNEINLDSDEDMFDNNLNFVDNQNCEQEEKNNLKNIDNEKNEKDKNMEDLLNINFEEEENLIENFNLNNVKYKDKEIISCEIQYYFLVKLMLFTMIKLKLSKSHFINFIKIINFLFKINLNFSFFEKIFKKINFENKKKYINKQNNSYFIYNNLKENIINFLNIDKYFNIIKENIKNIQEKIKINESNGIISDFYDGKNYKDFNYKINKENEIHLNIILNFDGISPFSVSTQNYHVVSGEIIELPIKHRFTYLNKLIFFFIKSDVIDINFIFDDFVKDLNDFFMNGFIFKNHLIRGKILCYTCDLPARSQLFNQG